MQSHADTLRCVGDSQTCLSGCAPIFPNSSWPSDSSRNMILSVQLERLQLNVPQDAYTVLSVGLCAVGSGYLLGVSPSRAHAAMCSQFAKKGRDSRCNGIGEPWFTLSRDPFLVPSLKIGWGDPGGAPVPRMPQTGAAGDAELTRGFADGKAGCDMGVGGDWPRWLSTWAPCVLISPMCKPVHEESELVVGVRVVTFEGPAGCNWREFAAPVDVVGCSNNFRMSIMSAPGCGSVPSVTARGSTVTCARLCCVTPNLVRHAAQQGGCIAADCNTHPVSQAWVLKKKGGKKRSSAKIQRDLILHHQKYRARNFTSWSKISYFTSQISANMGGAPHLPTWVARLCLPIKVETSMVFCKRCPVLS
jgi:hypothetical protein